jgi:hypothetical protein
MSLSKTVDSVELGPSAASATVAADVAVETVDSVELGPSAASATVAAEVAGA